MPICIFSFGEHDISQRFIHAQAQGFYGTPLYRKPQFKIYPYETTCGGSFQQFGGDGKTFDNYIFFEYKSWYGRHSAFVQSRETYSKKASIRRDPRGSNSPKQGHGGVIGWVEQLHDKPLRALLLILLMVFPPLFLVAPLSLVVFAGALVLFIAMYSVGKHFFLAYLLGRLL